jgi:hypothetical protein
VAITILDDIRSQLKKHIDNRLVDALLRQYKKMKENFALGRYEQSSLNGGKFCEVVIRILQNQTNEDQSFIPLGQSLGNAVNRLRSLEQIPKTQANDSLRLHIPRVALAVLDIRNNRDIGHVGGDVDSNYSDANLVVMSCDWIVAELLRLFYECTLDEAQKMVDGVLERNTCLVFDAGPGRKRILNPALSYKDKVLLLLSNEYPNPVPENILFGWTGHSNRSVFRRTVITPLDKEVLIDVHDGICQILPPGHTYVERNYESWQT